MVVCALLLSHHPWPFNLFFPFPFWVTTTTLPYSWAFTWISCFNHGQKPYHKGKKVKTSGIKLLYKSSIKSRKYTIVNLLLMASDHYQRIFLFIIFFPEWAYYFFFQKASLGSFQTYGLIPWQSIILLSYLSSKMVTRLSHYSHELLEGLNFKYFPGDSSAVMYSSSVDTAVYTTPSWLESAKSKSSLLLSAKTLSLLVNAVSQFAFQQTFYPEVNVSMKDKHGGMMVSGRLL